MIVFRMRGWIGFALVVALGVDVASAARPAVPEPIRRPASIEIGERNNVVGDSAIGEVAAQFFPGSQPEDFTFLAGDFIVPAQTTAELAALARGEGGRTAIRWFCDSYATSADDQPSLNSLLQVLADEEAEGGELAASALACPSRLGARRRPRRTGGSGSDWGVGALARGAARVGRAVSWIGTFLDRVAGTEGEDLGGAACHASSEQRASFDASACQTLFASSWHRRRGFARALKAANQGAACLRMRAVARPGLTLGQPAAPESPVGELSIAAVPCQ